LHTAAAEKVLVEKVPLIQDWKRMVVDSVVA